MTYQSQNVVESELRTGALVHYNLSSARKMVNLVIFSYSEQEQGKTFMKSIRSGGKQK